MIHDVAISYDGEESERLVATEAALAAAGLSVWSDRQVGDLGAEGLRERRIAPGGDHWAEITAAIDHSACLLCLDSPAWRSSEYCQKELRHAEAQGKRIIVADDPRLAHDASGEGLPAGDPAPLVEEVREGLGLGTAHARLLVAAEGERDVGLADEEPSREELSALAKADLVSLGISLTPPMRRCMAVLQRRHRMRRRRTSALVGAVLLALGVIAAVALIARDHARHDESRAKADRDRVESLALATRSSEAANSIAALGLARRALALDANPETIAALRQALGQLAGGVEIKGVGLSSPIAAAVSDDGRLVAESDGEGALALIETDDPGSAKVIDPSRAQAGAVLDISPDDRTALTISREEGAAEVIDVASAKVRSVEGTSDTAAVLYLAPDRAFAVSHGGVVAEFDPGEPEPQAKETARLAGPVRAAALAGIDPDGEPRLATLLDRVVEVTDLSRPGRPWRVALHVHQAPYRLGWETIRVCGHRLDLLTTDHPSDVALSFAIPYTLTDGGAATRTGGFIHSFGMICFPDGHALALDPTYGPHPFPAGGPLLPGLTEDSPTSSYYALASSDDGRWAVAGTDGYLKLVDLAAYGREFEVQRVESVAPARRGVIGFSRR